jgi:TatD DNase family protein
LIDTHAHLDFPELAHDLPGVFSRAAERGIHEIITIGIDIPSSRKAAELAQSYPHVYATVGIHPHGARILGADTLNTLHDLAGSKKVVAVGEIGLDYYRDRQPRALQRECLLQQIDIARKANLPVVFHIRDAFEDFFDSIADQAREVAGLVFHCFSGDWDVARKCLDLGGYLSIPGTVTFHKAESQQEVVRRAPMERLLLETDAPFLAPVPYRGKPNEPSFMRYTAAKVAELRGLTLDEVAECTTRNARQVFRLESADVQ